MKSYNRDCHIYESLEHKGFWVAEIFGGIYGDILCYARDPIRAEAFAWRELGERMVKRTYSKAYSVTKAMEK